MSMRHTDKPTHRVRRSDRSFPYLWLFRRKSLPTAASFGQAQDRRFWADDHPCMSAALKQLVESDYTLVQPSTRSNPSC